MTNSTRALGLRFRARHLLILVTYFAVLLGVMVPLIRLYGRSGMVNGSLVVLLASPWLLGVLVLVVERKGPVKYWASPLLLSLMAPALAITHDWVILDAWRRSGHVPNALVSLAINIFLIGSFSFYLVSMYPGSCPRCGHRSLIPLLRPWGRARRTVNTRWCGHCGAKYWRNSEGLWQKERRATWVDGLAHASPAETEADDSETQRPHTEQPGQAYPAPRAKRTRPSASGSSTGPTE